MQFTIPQLPCKTILAYGASAGLAVAIPIGATIIAKAFAESIKNSDTVKLTYNDIVFSTEKNKTITQK